MGKKVIVYVGGYGVPSDGQPDGNINRYVQGVIDSLSVQATRKDTVYVFLMGGATNPALPKVTEAMVLWKAWRELTPKHGVATNATVAIRDKGVDLWDNMISLQRILNTVPRDLLGKIVLYCEEHRLRRFTYIAKRVLPDYDLTVVPIDFDEREYTPRDYLARRAEYYSAVMSWKIPWFYENVELPRRMRKIGR